MSKTDPFRPGDDGVYFLPLGGSGEIGSNLNLYGADGKWLVVDFGVSFGDETTPGVDVLIPDPAFIADRRKDLLGIILTHGHEDHLGALEYLWPRLQVPVYATPFTAGLLRAKLAETEWGNKVPIHTVQAGARINLGPFEAEFIHITHSIPQSCAIALRTRHGAVLHTGDWKLDDQPLIGPVTDVAALQRVGSEKVLAMVGDSTNALVPGKSGSEAEVRVALTKLFTGFAGRRIAVTCFASNIARITSIAHAASQCGRRVALVGRSLHRYTEIARDLKMLEGAGPFLDDTAAMRLPRGQVVMICTGSQGEPRSALSKIAGEEHPEVELESGDVVVYSSREIPGNEKPITRIQNLLTQRGIEIVAAEDAGIHVSGHPARDELIQMYQWVRPQLAVPVHGEIRHQHEHARLAEACQVPRTIIPTNGAMIRLGPGPAEVIGHAPVGVLGVDGKVVRPLSHGPLRDRQKLVWQGVAFISLLMDERGRLMQEPVISFRGLVDDGETPAAVAEAISTVSAAIETMSKSARTDDKRVEDVAAGAIRRLVFERIGKKPVCSIHVLRV